VNALHPEWKMWTQFFGFDTMNGLTLDGLRSSHPIEVTVKDPAEIREIFDEISYSKGASILRMLERFLGEAAFRRGLRAYLREHSYGNARTEDLWRALEAASGKPVRAVMGTWTKQTGFPLLEVQVTRKNGWARLRRAVAAKELDTSDRIGLQNDAYDLTRAGYLPATTFLELTSEYRDEDDVTAWRMIVESLHDFETLISDEPYLNRLDAYG